jgi:hypothetical protein
MFDAKINVNVKNKVEKLNIIELSDIDYIQNLLFNIKYHSKMFFFEFE